MATVFPVNVSFSEGRVCPALIACFALLAWSTSFMNSNDVRSSTDKKWRGATGDFGDAVALPPVLLAQGVENDRGEFRKRGES